MRDGARRCRAWLLRGLVGSLLAGTGGSHGAPPVEPASALNAYQAGDFHLAARMLPGCAADGNARCQLALGLLYRAGQGVSRDEYRAFHWIGLAASQGLAPAQMELGVMYAHGVGVTDDQDKALEWVRRAARQGNPGARALYSHMLHPPPGAFGC